MKRSVAIVLILMLAIGAVLVACGDSGSESPKALSPTPSPSAQPEVTASPTSTTQATEVDTLKEVEGFFQNPPDFTVDLSEKTFEDPAVPTADMEIPQTQTGSLDMNIGLDLNVSATVPPISVPAASGLLTTPKLQLPSLPSISLPTSTPTATSTPPATAPATLQPNATTCASFSTVPSCSYVPEQYRQLCEQCKAAGY